ncbi:MAG TPA: alpha/beta hydrolase [Candidatus Acidoferrales bacterium]|nr:alpha/beta hydrolase [Candidatus Acidoferrales bacterium]
MLIHGVTSDSGTFWRVGPALAAAGQRAIAIDLPGHGRTGGWRGRHEFRHTGADVAAFVAAVGLDPARLAVLGHSWGGMVVAALPAAGLRPRRLILLDPPALPVEVMEAMTRDPEEQPAEDPAMATALIATSHPEWHPGDVQAKVDGLARFDREAVRAVLFDNGDWDAGLAMLADPAAAGVDAWLIRGDPQAGGLIPDAALPGLVARLGEDRVITIAEAPHSPQRTHIEATVRAILRALA